MKMVPQHSTKLTAIKRGRAPGHTFAASVKAAKGHVIPCTSSVVGENNGGCLPRFPGGSNNVRRVPDLLSGSGVQRNEAFQLS